MKPELLKRYATLLYAYGAGQFDIFAHVKRRILDEKYLRPDAALCLLTLYDHMILRPYAGYIPTPDAPGGLPTDVNSPPQMLLIKVDKSLKIIFDRLKEMRALEPRPDNLSSSHEVLKAITLEWKALSDIFLWG